MEKKQIIKFSAITLILLLIDLISKYFFYNLKIGENLSRITPSFNMGIARSIPVPMIITIIISIITLIVLIVMFYRGHLSAIITSLLVSWTIWNIVDRIIFWWVRDFLDIQIFNFPIFNVADILLNIGLWLFIIQTILAWKKEIKQ